MTDYIAAIDQGTTSTRFIVFDVHGDVVAVDQQEHQQIFPRPGWVEHDAMEIWRNTQSVIQTALRRFGIRREQIAALGITNQRETTLLWNRKTGQPYGHAIVWQDTRTDEIITALAREGGQDRFRQKTGLPLATYFSGPKIRWMLDADPEARAATERGDVLFGTMDTWLIWNLTGGTRGGIHVTDPTNASRSLLMNLQTLQWDDEILAEMNIPRSLLPEIRSSAEVYGRATGELEGIPIAGDLGDQQAALFGQVCFDPGDAKNTYGTGCFMLLNTGTTPLTSRYGLLTTPGYKIGNQPTVYCLEGSIAIAGALVQWLRDNLGLIRSSTEIEPLARTVADNGDVYFVPAFSGLFAPYWRTDARGVIAGLTRFANRGHIARAALEAVAYQTREVLEAMEKDSQLHLTTLKVDGGMVVNQLLMQFQSDQLGVPVVRPKVAETTSLGAAYAAGLAVGFWSDQDALRKNWQKQAEWQPNPDRAAADELFARWKKAVTRTFNWME